MVRAWGIPTATYTFKDASKRIEYSHHDVSYVEGNTHCYEDDGELHCYTTGGYTAEYDCEIRFTVDSNNRIVDSVYDGDWSACSSFFGAHQNPGAIPAGGVVVNMPAYEPHQGDSALHGAPETTVSIDRFRPLAAAAAHPGRIGERKTIGNLSMGTVIVRPPPGDLIRQAFAAELEAAGHRQRDHHAAVSVSGVVKRFRLRTDPTLLYWDVVVDGVVSVTVATRIGERSRDYSTTCSERTYKEPRQEVIARVVSACIRDLANQFRNDKGLAELLAAPRLSGVRQDSRYDRIFAHPLL